MVGEFIEQADALAREGVSAAQSLTTSATPSSSFTVDAVTPLDILALPEGPAAVTAYFSQHPEQWHAFLATDPAQKLAAMLS